MNRITPLAAAIALCMLTPSLVRSQEAVPTTGGQEQTGHYNPVHGWPKQVHDGWVGGSNQGVFAESPDRIFITQRGWLPELERPRNTAVPEFGPSLSFPVNQVPFRNASQGPVASPPNYSASEAVTKDGVDYLWSDTIYIVDGNGDLVESWTQWDSLLKRPHAIYENPYDPEKHVWVVDDAGHVVHKFTNDGKQKVMTLGTQDTPGNDESHFNRPTFLAWLPDSTLFVADGYANTRVVKFDADGNYLLAWGQRGSNTEGPVRGTPDTRPGYFNTVHGIAVDAQRRVYVSDRSNRLIQVFDENGNFLRQWTIGESPAHIYSLYMAVDQTLWGLDSGTMRIVAWDLDGNYKYSFGYLGDPPGGLFGPHQISVDQEGNVYIAQVSNGYTTKWRPMRGADPAKLVGKPFGFSWAE